MTRDRAVRAATTIGHRVATGRSPDRCRDDSGGVWIITGWVVGFIVWLGIVAMWRAGFTPVTPLVNVRDCEPAAVALAERVTVLRLASIDRIVVLAGMPTPVTDMPTESRELSDR
jgi:hypothetical protein